MMYKYAAINFDSGYQTTKKKVNLMGILTGKKILIAGIASEKSIATGIADAMFEQGAELAFTYLNDRLKDRLKDSVIAVAERCHSKLVFPCDVSSDDEIKGLFDALSTRWPWGK